MRFAFFSLCLAVLEATQHSKPLSVNECYICNSVKDKGCSPLDKKVADKRYRYKCDVDQNVNKTEKEKKNVNVYKYNDSIVTEFKCRKRLQIIKEAKKSSETRVIRECAPARKDYVNSDIRGRNGVRQLTYYCSTDLCNSIPSPIPALTASRLCAAVLIVSCFFS